MSERSFFAISFSCNTLRFEDELYTALIILSIDINTYFRILTTVQFPSEHSIYRNDGCSMLVRKLGLFFVNCLVQFNYATGVHSNRMHTQSPQLLPWMPKVLGNRAHTFRYSVCSANNMSQ